MMMIAPENDGGPLLSPELSPLKSQSLARSRTFLLFGPDLLRGASIIIYLFKQQRSTQYGKHHPIFIIYYPGGVQLESYQAHPFKPV